MSGIFGALANGSARQAADTRDPMDDRYFGGPYTVGNFVVNPETAVSASAVSACTMLLGEIIGSLPLEFPRNDSVTNGGAYPFADVLAHYPNPLTTGAEFWATMAFNAVLRGSAYAEPVVISANEIEVWPLRPAGISEDHSERRFRVHYSYEDGRGRVFGAGQLFSVAGLSADGVYAVVPWKVARTAIEMANVLEQFGRNFFKNGARPSGTLTTEQELSGGAAERLSADFNGNFAGFLNAGKVPVLEQGLKYVPVSSSNTDSQYIELRRNQVREIARNWRIPLHMLGEAETDKSAEQQALEFVKYVIRPWTRRIEQAIARDIMTPDHRKEWSPRFNMDGLLRGDSTTQWRNAVLARTASAMSVDELRRDWFGLPVFDEDWSRDPRQPLNSNRAADTATGGMTAPQDRSDA